MSVFLPFLIWLIIIIGVILAITWLNRWNVARKGYWLLGGYVTILLISVVVYYFIPAEANEVKSNSGNKFTLSGVLYEGRTIDSVVKYLKKEWEFDYHETSIYLDYEGDLQDVLSIAVARTDEEKIKAAFYQTPFIVSGKDISEQINPMDVRLNKHELIIEASMTELEYTTFSKGFPVGQFTEKRDEWSSWVDLESGEQLLYLQIPRQVEITAGPNVHVEYLN